MFKIGDLVQHKTTKITGIVIGYGVRQTDCDYALRTLRDRAITLKVELKSDESIKPIAEDVCDKWKIRHERVLACSLPYFPQRKLSKVS